MKWNKEKFVKDIQSKASKEASRIGENLCLFIVEEADEVVWGKASNMGVLGFKAKSDSGLIPLFYITTKGTIKFCLNGLREKNFSKVVLKEYLVKLESNFLKDFDESAYSVDSFIGMDDLFTMSSQVDKFKMCIRSVVHKLRL